MNIFTFIFDAEYFLLKNFVKIFFLTNIKNAESEVPTQKERS